MARNDEATRLKPGRSGNPKGRPKGSRHRLSERFLAALCEDFEANGRSVIEALRICASILPKQVENLPNPLADLTDDELEQLDAWLASFRAQPTQAALVSP